MNETNTQDRDFTYDDPHEVKVRLMTPKEKKETRNKLLTSLFKGRAEIIKRTNA